jgi:hypothetical protein
VSSNEREWLIGDPEAEVAVHVEPLAGHTDEEVADRLRGAGAAKVSALAPGFLSARASRAVLDSLRDIATVTPKATKGMRRN